MSTTAIWIIVAVAVLAVIAFAVMRQRPPADSVPVAPEDPAPWLEDEGEAHVVERDPEIRWTDQIGARTPMLDDDARLRLITDLGLIHAAWVVPVLQQAYSEERLLSHRKAALHALAACHHPDARSTLASAARSPGEEERAIAMTALRAESAQR